MRVPVLALLFLAAAACSAQQPVSGAASSTHSEAVLAAPNAKARVGADRVEVQDGEIRVNGISYGRVPDGAKVRYVLENGQSHLSVDGVERTPLPEK